MSTGRDHCRNDRGELAALDVSLQRRALQQRRLLNEVAPALLALVRRLA